jgi:hypothetical protein
MDEQERTGEMDYRCEWSKRRKTGDHGVGRSDPMSGLVPAEKKACLVCHSDELYPLCLIDGWTIQKCRNCGFITTAQAERVDWRSLYDDTYFHGGKYYNYREDEPVLKRHFRRRLQDVLDYRCRGRLVEIGAAYGYFLELAQKHFTCLGFEINEKAAWAASTTTTAYGRNRNERTWTGGVGAIPDARTSSRCGTRSSISIDQITTLHKRRVYLARMACCS